MPRFLALEWDAGEARVVVARSRGKEMTVEHAFAVELAPRDPGQTFADVNVGERIAAALAARGVTRGETLVAVGRANIELRQLTLPACPEDEQPEMVRFQALRQFSGIGEDWPLDFVPLETGNEDTLTVLAAAISPEMVQHIRATCEAGEMTPRHLVLRPFAAASLLKRHDRTSLQPCRLMVDLLRDEADLTVLVGQQVALVRTVRLAATDDVNAQSRALLGEIRRTIAAAHNQLRDQRVEKVVICGTGSGQETIQGLVQRELGQDVDLFDPFADLRLESDLAASRPEYPGRFAPLLGMLLDEVHNSAHQIDFLHPRKKAAAPNKNRRNILIGATAAVLLLAIVFMVWSQSAAIDRDIETLTEQLNSQKETVQAAEVKRAHAAAVEQFLKSDIPWLDEVDRLARELPPPEDILVEKLDLATRMPEGGQMVLDGYARESDHIREVGDVLRGDDRQVQSTGGQYDPRRGQYPWHFRNTVFVEPQMPAPPAEAGATNEADQDTKEQPDDQA
jgi:Tfp pilus assembly PilM family ATPase